MFLKMVKEAMDTIDRMVRKKLSMDKIDRTREKKKLLTSSLKALFSNLPCSVSKQKSC